MTQANGHDTNAEQANVQQDPAAAYINNMVQTAIGVTLRGLISSAPIGTPPDLILNLAAFHLGNVMANSVVADLKVQFEIRKHFKSAFAEGIEKAQMKSPPAAAAPMMSSPINLKG